MDKVMVNLTSDEMEKCISFSKKSAESQQPIEFGQHDTLPRDTAEIARDNLIGKMAELAVSRKLRELFGLHIPIDYEIYPRGEWDDCDISINGWNIDIKSTRIGHPLNSGRIESACTISMASTMSLIFRAGKSVLKRP